MLEYEVSGVPLNSEYCTNKLLLVLISVLILLSPIQLHANDTTARVGAGGITLLKTENIRMLQEILELSSEKITVRYRFLNESDHDIQTTVAFPIPDYEYDPDTIDSIQSRAYSKFYNFKNWTDGKLVDVKRERKALIGTTDITEGLRNIGLTDNQIFETFGEQTSDGATAITSKQRDKVSELLFGISVENQDDPFWKVSETIYWEQTFPKGKEIEVMHEYIPNRGNAPNYISSSSRKEFAQPIPKAFSLSNKDAKSPKEACINKETIRAIQHKVNKILTKSPKSLVGVNLYDVEYILGTGRNWKGPIGNFILRIKKETPDQLVSLCFPGKPKQINPTTLEYMQTNYTPQDRLVVYFISVWKYD